MIRDTTQLDEDPADTNQDPSMETSEPAKLDKDTRYLRDIFFVGSTGKELCKIIRFHGAPNAQSYPTVHGKEEQSPIGGVLHCSDEIVAVDGRDTKGLSEKELTEIFADTGHSSQKQIKLSILSLVATSEGHDFDLEDSEGTISISESLVEVWISW